MRPHEPDPPLLLVDVHMRSTWTTHRSLETASIQWPSGPKAEIRLYDCNLFKTVLLDYITNLYRRKFSTFYSDERRNSDKKDTNFFAWEEDRMTSVDSIFNFLCGCPHEACPPSTCVHLSLAPLKPSVWMSQIDGPLTCKQTGSFSECWNNQEIANITELVAFSFIIIIIIL